MKPHVCGYCEQPLALIESADGQTYYQCLYCDCGEGNVPVEECLVSTYEDANNGKYCHVGEGAKPEGYKYKNSIRLSQGRQKGKANIKMLCQQFAMSSDLQNEMLSIFQGLQSRHLEAASGAVFVTVARQASSQGLKPKMTLQQVSSIIDVSVPKIAMMIKVLKKQNIVDQIGTGAITDASDVVRAVLPDFQLTDPTSGVDIKAQVNALTEKIIQVVQRRSSQSLDPNCLTMAASHLAYQSVCYQRGLANGVVQESSATSLEDFLDLAKFTVNKTLIRSVKNSACLITRELKKLLEKMPWIQRRARVSFNTFILRHVEEILEFQELTCGLLSQEAEAKRRDELAAAPHPIIPRELTAEEEAALEREELSEQDLPDDELSGYVRSAQEVESLKRWMDSS